MPAPVPGKNLPRYDDDDTILLKGRELNQLAKRIEESRPIPGDGITGRPTPDGIVISGGGVGGFSPRPFSPVELTEVDSIVTVGVYPGIVTSSNPKAAVATGKGREYEVPELGGVPMTDLPAERLTVTENDFVTVKIERDVDGSMTAPVSIVVRSSDDSDHYEPVSPNTPTGKTSTHDYWALFQILKDDDDNYYTRQIWDGNIDLTPFLWTGENVGTGAGVYYQYNPATAEFEFRKIEGIYGITEIESGENINLEFLGDNVGTRGQNVYVPQAESEAKPGSPEEAQFKKLVELDTDPQIRVEADGDDHIQVRGNDNNTNHLIESADTPAGADITNHIIRDGLVKSSTNLRYLQIEI